MQTFEFFGSLVQFDLGGLGLGDLLLKLLALVADFNGQLLDLEGKLLDLGLVSTAVLLEGEVILLLLSGGEGPLFQLLLIPVHLQFELVHALVSLENHILNVVQAILLVRDSLLKLFDFVLKTTRLALSNLFHVLFGFNLFVFGVDQRLSVNEFHLN